MSTTTVAGHRVDRDDDGFFTDPVQWNPSMAPDLAAAEGIDQLTAEHWKVLDLLRLEYAERGTEPGVRTLGRRSGIPVRRLYELFPGAPARVAARIAGLPAPRTTPLA